MLEAELQHTVPHLTEKGSTTKHSRQVLLAVKERTAGHRRRSSLSIRRITSCQQVDFRAIPAFAEQSCLKRRNSLYSRGASACSSRREVLAQKAPPFGWIHGDLSFDGIS